MTDRRLKNAKPGETPGFVVPASFAGLALDRPLLMGVLNVTPDSFSDRRDIFDPDRAVADGLALATQGADIVDVGGESTRPGAEPIDQAEELRRAIPVVRGLVREGLRVSIDTRHAAVMRAAIGMGAHIINDVSALRDDPESLDVVAGSDVAVILMHRRGVAPTYYSGPDYEDVVTEVRDFLASRLEACRQASIAPERIALDPGIGFGKSIEQNLQLVLDLQHFAGLGRPLLVGASRKGFIGRLTGVRTPADRLAGSLAVALEAARCGAHILRVHDVAATREALAIHAAFNRVSRGEPASPPAAPGLGSPA